MLDQLKGVFAPAGLRLATWSLILVACAGLVSCAVNDSGVRGTEDSASGSGASATARMRPQAPGRQLPGEVGPLDPGDPPPPPAHEFGVLLHEGARDFRLARRLTGAAFEQRHDELAAQGFHLHDLEIVAEGPAPSFSGLWFYGAGEQRLELGTEARTFAATAIGSALANFRPVDVETYVRNGERLFAGVWRREAPLLSLEFDIEEAELRALASGGKTLEDVESWPTARGRRYMALRRAATEDSRLLLHLEPTAFDTQVASLIANGFRPLELEIDDLGGAPRYTSTWEKGEEAFWLFLGLSESLQDCRIVSLGVEAPELQPVDLAGCRALGNPGFQLPGRSVTIGELLEAIRVESRVPSRAPTTGPTTGPAAPARGRVAASTVVVAHGGDPHHHPDLPLDVLTLPGGPMHLHDFAFTRRPLDNPAAAICNPLGCSTRHEGVVHDTGPSGPGI